MKYLLLGKNIPSNSTMDGDIFENSYLEFLKNASQKYMKNLLGKIIPSNSTMAGENFENSYLEFLKNASKIHEKLIRQNHSF